MIIFFQNQLAKGWGLDAKPAYFSGNLWRYLVAMLQYMG